MTPRLRSIVIAGTMIVVVSVAATAQKRGAAAPAAARRAGRATAPPPVVADVKLDSLRSATTAPPPKVARNPFRFHEAPAPVAPRAARQPTAAPAFVPPPAPIGPPPPPPIALRFIGLIEAPQRSGRVALLSDGRGGLMNGREGDIIEGRYRVLRVGTDSIDLAYADGRGRQTIRLSGQ
jgi:hypothetical protein